ncbi:alpha/beta fold hydrolase [Oceaniglobus trochenteri]|uniref:alpha/beta fold hydrolase n=1 Tax=Oceaniglobus trochenteri TaxID=2763260 RepID=UPI001D001961|nr:alpha/beta hydrolase [Oceaniglobus trochenteri]
MVALTMQKAPFHAEVAGAPEGGETHWATTADGLRIRLAHWAKGDKGTVLLFPGRTEYIEKYGPAAGEFAARGYAMLSVDWRGQGLADRMIDDPLGGHVVEFTDYQKDVAALVEAGERLNLPRPWYLVGHSMGGAIGLRALNEGLAVKAAVFSAPMWGITIAPSLRPLAWSLSWASRGLGFGHAFAPGTSNQSYILGNGFDDNMLTGDRGMWDWMKAQLSAHPELVLGGPSLRWLYEALNDTRALARMPSPSIPALTVLGTDERIVDPGRIKARMADWPGASTLMIEDGRHEVMMETPERRARFYDAACALFDANR